jgi:hypothetical protein
MERRGFMSFVIAVYVNEGIVLASDRRTTYSNTTKNGDETIIELGIHTTNSTEKTFMCPNKCGISTCGEASINEKPITGYIQQFIREKIHEETDISSIPKMLIDYFNAFEPIPNTNFIVAGYTKDSETKQQIFKINIGNQKIESIDTENQGATWDGEVLTLVRLIQNCAIKNEDGTYTDLPQNDISWNFFTLQDAVDFAKYAVETTIKTMHFQNVVETVGGNVDILIIKPNEIKWLEKEELHL